MLNPFTLMNYLPFAFARLGRPGVSWGAASFKIAFGFKGFKFFLHSGDASKYTTVCTPPLKFLCLFPVTLGNTRRGTPPSWYINKL
jgi:hypothetical protein